MSSKTFPVQGTGAHWLPERRWEAGWGKPCLCSEEDARRAYAEYHRRYPGQTFERLMQRGGFGRAEMDEFAPGWTPIDRESR